MNLFPIAFALAAGIYSSPYLSFLTMLIAGVIFTAVTLVFVRRLPDAVGRAALCFAFVAGLALYHVGIMTDIDYIGEYVTARGIIMELPDKSYDTTRYVLLCKELECYKGSYAPNKKILVSSKESFKCGDCVTVMGKLSEISNDPKAFGFDSRRTYASRGIHCRMAALEMTASDKWFFCARPDFLVNIVRSNIADIIYSRYDGDTAAALTAVLTGYKSGFSEEYNDILSRTSMRSLFYPAFAHVAFLVFLVGYFGGIIPKRARDIILVVLLGFYALYSSSNPSSLKCAAAIGTLVLSKRFSGSGSLLNSVSLFIVISLLLDPMLVFNTSYVISCSATVLLDRLRPVFKSKKRIRRFFLRFAVLYIGMLPLYAYFIGHTSIYSYLASMIFIPLTSLMTFAGFPFVFICATGGDAPAMTYMVSILEKIPYVINALPFSNIILPRPSPLFLAAFYSTLAALWYFKTKRHERLRPMAVLAAGLAAACLITPLSRIDRLRLDFIDVGQGDAALLHVPLSGNILIDGGGGPEFSEYNIGKNVFVPYLASHGATIIQAAVVSHFHKDHCEGIIEAVKSLTVKNLFLPDSLPDSHLRAELEAEAKKRGTKLWYVTSPIHVRMDDVDLNIYPPDAAVLKNGTENDTSMLVEVRYGEFNGYFTGDMTTKGERQAVKRGIVKEAEVLKVSHHGSATSSDRIFINEISPMISLIGAGEGNGYGLPRKNVLERLVGSRIYRTDRDGTISIYADKNANITVETEK